MLKHLELGFLIGQASDEWKSTQIILEQIELLIVPSFGVSLQNRDYICQAHTVKRDRARVL